MLKEAVSVTLDADNLLWLRAPRVEIRLPPLAHRRRIEHQGVIA